VARHERGQLLRFLASAFGGLTAPGQHAVFGTSRVQLLGVTGTSAKADGLASQRKSLSSADLRSSPIAPAVPGTAIACWNPAF